MEYQLVLRGDPASGTQLLSTTIQAAMLLRRVLDVRSDPVSNGAYGSKASSSLTISRSLTASITPRETPKP